MKKNLDDSTFQNNLTIPSKATDNLREVSRKSVAFNRTNPTSKMEKQKSVRAELLDAFREANRIHRLNKTMVEKQVILNTLGIISYEVKQRNWWKSWVKVRTVLRFLFLLKTIIYEKAVFGINVNTRPLIYGEAKYESEAKFISEQEKFSNFLCGIDSITKKKQAEQKWYIIYEDSLFSKIWFVFTIGMFFYTVFFIPYKIAFLANINTNTIDLIFSMRFYFDVLFGFFTAHRVNGFVSNSLKNAAINYLRTWFVIDFICVLPYDYMLSGQSAEFPIIFQLTKLIMLAKIINLSRGLFRSQYFRILKHYYEFNKKLTEFMTFFLVLICFSHIIACLWVFATFFEDEQEKWINQATISLPFNNNAELYLAALFWSYNTICGIGLGGILPVTPLEKTFNVILIAAGTAFYTFHLGSLSHLLSESRKVSALISNRFSFLNDVSNKRTIDKGLLEKITVNLELVEQNENGSQNALTYGFLQDISVELTYELTRHLYHDLITKVILFQNKNIFFMAQIVEYIQARKVQSGEVVYLENSNVNFLYFIISGKVGFFKNHFNPFRIYVEGSYFGEIEILKGCLHEFTVKALVDTQLLMLPKEIYLSKMVNFPIIHEEMLLTAIKRDTLNKRSEAIFEQFDYILLNNNNQQENSERLYQLFESSYNATLEMKQKILSFANQEKIKNTLFHKKDEFLEESLCKTNIKNTPSRQSSSRSMTSAKKSETIEKMNDLNLNIVKFKIDQIKVETRAINKMLIEMFSNFLDRTLYVIKKKHYKDFGMQFNPYSDDQLIANDIYQETKFSPENKSKFGSNLVLQSNSVSRKKQLYKMNSSQKKSLEELRGTTVRSVSFEKDFKQIKLEKEPKVSIQSLERSMTIPADYESSEPNKIRLFFQKIFLKRRDVLPEVSKSRKIVPMSLESRDSEEQIFQYSEEIIEPIKFDFSGIE